MRNERSKLPPGRKWPTAQGVLIALISIATGAAVLLISVEVARSQGSAELEHLKTIIELVAVAAGLPAAIFALFNYAADVDERKRAELWRRRQFVEERFSRFEANSRVEAAMTMLDYWDRPVLLPGSDKLVRVSNELLTRALIAGKSKLVMNEVLIRDAFDEFFDGLDRLGTMWDVGLISLEDLLPYVRYWLELLDSGPRHRNEEFGPVVRSYIREFHFEALERLMKAAGFPICSEQDELIVENYKKSNGSIQIAPENGRIGQHGGKEHIMRGFRLAAAVLAAAAILLPSTVAAADNNEMRLVDTTRDFARIWDETASLPDAKRAAAFKDAFAKVLPGFYDEKRFKQTPELYDARLLVKLKAYPDRRASIARVANDFEGLFAPARRSFEAQFGPLRGYPPVYLVNSLGEFDGGTRDLREGTRLLFGADVIDQLYKSTPIQPFFHHELFHILHHGTFPECEQMWCSLWAEGLAVYVASRLNPTADDAALLLNFPKPLRTAVEGHRTEAICAVSSRLHSTDEADLAPFFQGGVTPLSANLPPRFAYYVGYLVAQDLGRTRSLKQLAALPPDQVRSLVEHSLAAMAKC